MAVRQYIGARYVLKIYKNSQDPQSAEWEAGIAYEPLVMVNYNNSSYISRKDVPANVGNPVDNPTYWALSGLYNGQIAQLQEDLTELDQTVDGMINNVGKNKLAGKSVICKTLVQKPAYLKTLADTANECTLQGAAFNSNRNTYVIGILEADGQTSYLVELSMSDGISVINRKTYINHEMGHINDITYNPNTNKYYVCTLAEGNVNNECVSVNPTTLEVEETIQLYPDTTVQTEGSMCIAYDEVNDRYFSMSQYAIYVYDSDFNMTKTINYPLLTSYIANGFGYNQGIVNAIFAYKGFVGLGIFGYAENRNNGICLALVDVDSEETFVTWNIENSAVNEELEGVFVKGDDIYFTTGQTYYSLYRVLIQGKPTFNKQDFILGGGLNVGNSIDLDTLFTPGNYVVDATTPNNPFAATAKLFVFYNSNACVQLLISYATDREFIMTRTCNPVNGSDAWSAWNYCRSYYQDNVPKTISITSYTTVGFVTNSGKEIIFNLPLERYASGSFGGSLVLAGSVTMRDAGTGKYIADGVTTNITAAIANMSVTTALAGNSSMIQVTLKRQDGAAFKHTDNTTIINNTIISVTTSGGFTMTHNV